MKRTHTGCTSRSTQLIIAAAISAAVSSACSISRTHKAVQLDTVLQGVADPAMQQRWKRADAEGKLPPFDALAAPAKTVVRRQPVVMREPVTEPRRPVINAATVATVEPFSRTPIDAYDGPFQVLKHEPGLLVGTTNSSREPLELHYKLPNGARAITLRRDDALVLTLRDQVDDSALQRRVVLRRREGAALLVYLAEGSNTPYRQSISSVHLDIRQRSDGENPHPPVEVTYGGATVVLKPGTHARIGRADRAAEIHLLESSARTKAQTMLGEGQRFYVNLILYAAQ